VPGVKIRYQGSIRPQSRFAHDFVSGVSLVNAGLMSSRLARQWRCPPLECCAGRIFLLCFWSGFFLLGTSRHGRHDW